jgi:hypothetical protein
MSFQIKHLELQDIASVSALDKKWFGNYGVTTAELKVKIQESPTTNIVLYENNQLVGFAMFEIITDKLPTDYVGNLVPVSKTMFIQQFTTTTNYNKHNNDVDQELLNALEIKAQEIGCTQIWEALAVDHPYRTENNPQFDVFGFYLSAGFRAEEEKLAWQPSPETKIDCAVISKSI